MPPLASKLSLLHLFMYAYAFIYQKNHVLYTVHPLAVMHQY